MKATTTKTATAELVVATVVKDKGDGTLRACIVRSPQLAAGDFRVDNEQEQEQEQDALIQRQGVVRHMV